MEGQDRELFEAQSSNLVSGLRTTFEKKNEGQVYVNEEQKWEIFQTKKNSTSKNPGVGKCVSHSLKCLRAAYVPDAALRSANSQRINLILLLKCSL